MSLAKVSVGFGQAGNYSRFGQLSSFKFGSSFPQNSLRSFSTKKTFSGTVSSTTKDPLRANFSTFLRYNISVFQKNYYCTPTKKLTTALDVLKTIKESGAVGKEQIDFLDQILANPEHASSQYILGTMHYNGE